MMPDKCMLFTDNIAELSRDSRLTREVPFFRLHCRAKDGMQMVQHRAGRGRVCAPAAKEATRYLAVAVLAALTAACATLSPTSPDEEKVKVVTERSAARWKAIIDKDFGAAYVFMSPASKVDVPEARFKTYASRLNYRKVDIKDVTCENEICKVKLILTYDAHKMRGVNTPLEESWIIERGNAWYVWPL